MNPDPKSKPPEPRRVDWKQGEAPAGVMQQVAVSKAPDELPGDITWRGEPATIAQLLDVRDAARSFVTLWDLAKVLGVASQSGAHVVPLLAAVEALRRTLHAVYDAAALARPTSPPADPMCDPKTARPRTG